ncbi:hypothetical protein [Lederbergia citri]|uniref:Uncharacterized protein n=1 Tax=Lederbergia citri TaxID=2833580 RepID=A0A942TE98_9BACI|nr:hypothetical protein [Lederbergia citri]MBS4194647.1 hypothetical protein [Lederbergia citri]
MRRNEDGFTVVEGLLSFAVAIFICAFLFPLLFKMLFHLYDGKREMIANRLLYEHIEQHFPIENSSKEIRVIRNVEYELTIERNGDDFWKACVKYDEHQKCYE